MRGEQGPQGLLARDFLRSQIIGREVWISSLKDKRGKYGRYLADIWLQDASREYININDALVTAGHAQYASY